MIAACLLLSVGLAAVPDGGALQANATVEIRVALLEELADRPGRGEPRVRLAFEHVAGRWQASYTEAPLAISLEKLRQRSPSRLQWTVCSGGRNRGELQSVLPREWGTFSVLGTHVLPQGVRPPWIGRPDMQFAGWSDVPVHQPLLLTSAGRCGDPDGWREAQVPPAVLEGLRTTFRATAEGSDDPMPYVDSQLQLIESRRARSGAVLVALGLVDWPGDGPPPEWVRQTFFISERGETRRLGHDLTFVGAADLEGDERSELILFERSYNSNGYKLVPGDGSPPVEISWHYH